MVVGSCFGQYPGPSDNEDPEPPKKFYICLLVNWAWFIAAILG